MDLFMLIETSVKLAELGVPSAEAEAAGLTVGVDWRGDPAVSVTEAAEFVRRRSEATATPTERSR